MKQRTEAFYEELEKCIRIVPKNDKLVLVCDFSARVGRDNQAWTNVLGRHGIGKENSNGTLLLRLCSELQLAVTNTFFQQADIPGCTQDLSIGT